MQLALEFGDPADIACEHISPPLIYVAVCDRE
jgi:hypothetical protein